MGISPFSKSSHDVQVCTDPINKNPNPKVWNILKNQKIGNMLLIKINYPNCTNYEGDKILVFENVTLKDLKNQKSIDPHFSDNNKYHNPEEIKQILKKYDIAGIVLLHDVGFSEYLIQINPSYSCAYVDEALGALRVKAKASELLGGAEERNKKVKDTSNMLHHFSEVGKIVFTGINQLSETVDKISNAEHFGEGHSTNQSQNN